MTTTVEQVTDKTSKVQLSRLIRASRQRAFDAWTRPEYIRQWFGPADKTVSEVEVDARENGAYRIAMKGAEVVGANADALVTGRYVKVVPHELLSFTWNGSWAAGEETLVTVTFKDVAGGTEVTVTHELFKSEMSRNGHEMGWTGGLEKMAKLFDGN
jgi:uncharacterized protein YndB with AHSA1/START domain